MSKLPRHEIVAVLAKRSTGRINAKEFSAEVAAYLMSEHRTADLESILRDIMQYRADHGIVEVIAVSAFPLNPKVQRDIEAQIRELYPAAKQIIITQELDTEVVGGVRLELANQQLDLSVRAKLNHFKQLTVTGKD